MQKQLEARLVCYRQGNVRGDVLVEATDINVVLRLGEVSALTFKLPGLYSMGTDAGYVNYTRALIDNWDVALEVSWGEGWYEPFNARFEIVKEERDDDLYGKVALTGVGIVSDLAYGFNLNTNRIGKETGTHDYSMVGAAQIMSEWITSAQSQGSMPRLRWRRSGSGYLTDTAHGWTTAVDSAGKTWAANSKVNAGFQRIASALDVQRSLVGAVEWVTRGNTLCLYNTGTLEKPLKPGGVELILGRELESIPLAREISERVQRVVAFGEKGINRAASNGSVGGTRGPRTRAVTVGGEKETANLTARAEAEVAARQGIREELRRDMDLLHAEFLPWRDFELGARVISEGWTTAREEYTVSELILRETGPEHGLQVAVTLGDPLKSSVERIQMAVRNLSGSSGDAQQGGASGGVAGGGGSISDPRADEGPPAAPVISSLEVHHTISPSGFTTASIQVAWNPVTLAASGEPLWRDILRYHVEGRDGRDPSNPWVDWGSTGGHRGATSLVKDGLFPGQSYWVRVFAETQEGRSDPSTEVEIFTGQDSTPPPQPKPPNLSTAQGMVTAEVTGEFVNDAARPADLSHYEVWVKRGTGDAALHSTVTGKGVAIIGSTRGEQVEVYLVAVDTSQNESTPSATVSITTLGILDEPQIKQRFEDADQYFSDIRSELEAVDAAINGPNGIVEGVAEAKQAADSKSTIFRFYSSTIPPAAPTFDGNSPGDVAWAFSNNNLSGPITGQWTWDGYWKPSTIDSNIIANLTVDKLVSTGNAEFNNAVVETLMGQTAFFNNLQAMRVQVGGAGLDQFPDPWFKNTSAWTGSGTTAIADASMPGGGALRIIRGSSSGEFGSAYGQDPSMEVVPEATYRFRALVRGYQVSGLTYVTVRLTGKTTTGIAATASKVISLPSNFTSTTVPVEGLIEVPLNWQGPVNIGLYAGNGTGELRIGAAHFERMTDKTLITEGSIMTEHLAAGAIIADVVDSGSFHGKWFEGGIFEGAEFRTASSGRRLQMDSNGLRAYNANGTMTFSLTGTSGTIQGFSVTGGTLTGAVIRSSASGRRIEIDNQNTGGRLRYLDSLGYSRIAMEVNAGGGYLSFYTTSGSEALKVSEADGLTINQSTIVMNSTRFAGEWTGAVDLAATTLTLRCSDIRLGSSGGVYGLSWKVRYARGGTTSNPVHAAILEYQGGPSSMPPITGGFPLAMSANSDGGGTVCVTTSSRRAKADIRDIEVDPYRILDVRPRDWLDRAALEADPTLTTRTPGVVAEEVEDAGLSEFVSYYDGEVQGVMYDRLPVLFIPIIKDLVKRIETLEGART